MTDDPGAQPPAGAASVGASPVGEPSVGAEPLGAGPLGAGQVGPGLTGASSVGIAVPAALVGVARRGWRRGRAAQQVPDPGEESRADWGWVEEWRRGAEPTPWGPGLALAGFAALIIGAAVYVISAGLADRPLIALVANIVVAAGLAPALWMSRQLPVLRWVSLGGAVGTVVAWVSILFFPNI